MDKENWDDVFEIISENKSDSNKNQFVNAKVEEILKCAQSKIEILNKLRLSGKKYEKGNTPLIYTAQIGNSQII